VIPKNVFYARRDNHCTKCEFWKGACLKGHQLSSPQGCPIKKFDPINGADYAPDRPALEAPAVPPPGNCCGKGDDELKPMSWAQAITHLKDSMAQWERDGWPLLPDASYQARVNRCQDECPHYRWFQCRLCKCFVFTKAKLPHETCPAGRWPV
jgi:hypothetical protein